MRNPIAQNVILQGAAQAKSSVSSSVERETIYDLVARNAAGELLWHERFTNIVVNVGLDDSLDKHLKGSAYTATWYLGLLSGTPTVDPTDTMGSHAGWTEITAHNQATRPQIVLGTVSSQSVDNSGSPIVYTITANGTTVGGAFVTNNNVVGGSTGLLYSAGAFTAADKGLDNGDTLTVTTTFTASRPA